MVVGVAIAIKTVAAVKTTTTTKMTNENVQTE